MGIVVIEPRESFLMNETDVAESALFESINDHETQVMEDIRKQVSIVEAKIMHEIETYRSAIARIEKYGERRKEVERRLDLQYRPKVAEALDTKRGWTLEKKRLKKLNELEAINQLLKSRSDEGFFIFEKNIDTLVKQIRGTKDNVIAKSNGILKIFKDPRCPLSIGIATFAKKIVSAWQNPFACSYVIVNVTSEFPQAMDIILAEFYKACVYTFPERTVDSESAWYLEEEEYYKRIESVMRLYGALVQTCDGDASNIHGIEHGWAWLARFLNNKISANNYNRAAATALHAFLETAGYGLHQMYKSHFLKLLDVVREQFLVKLREAEKGSSEVRVIRTCIAGYLDKRMYLNEPEGRSMKTNLLSTELSAEVQYQSKPSLFF